MKLSLTGGGVVGLAAVAALGLGALYVYSKRDTIAKAAGAAVDAVNPTSDKNVAYGAVNAAGAAVTGDKDFTLGGWLWDTFNKDKNAEIATMLQGSKPAAPVVDQSIQDRWDYYARGGQAAASGSGSKSSDDVTGWPTYAWGA